ncbi:hypothetical protein [Ralstonia insidiosa]|nr:hypothetical protein [Ralstonia insidiosa]
MPTQVSQPWGLPAACPNIKRTGHLKKITARPMPRPDLAHQHTSAVPEPDRSGESTSSATGHGAHSLRRTAGAWERMAMLLLALWASAQIIPDALRLVDSFQYGTPGFYANNDGKIYWVNPEVADLPVHRNDCIDLQRTPLPERLAVFAGMGGMQYLRHDQILNLSIIPAESCARAEDTPSIPTLIRSRPATTSIEAKLMLTLQELLGLGFIAVGLILTWQRPTLMTWGFFFYSAWFNPGPNFIATAYLQSFPAILVLQEIVQSIIAALGIVGLILFSLRFPHDTAEGPWQKYERALPVVCVLLTIVHLWGLGASFGFPVERAARLSYLADALLACSILMIFSLRMRAQSPEDRQRTRWVFWLGGPGLITFLLADMIEATTILGEDFHPPEWVLAILYVLSASLAIAVWHAVRRHRVIDVKFALSRGATLVLTWLLLGAALGACGLLLEDELKALLIGADWLAEDDLKAIFSVRALSFSLPMIFFQLGFEFLHEQLNHGCDLLFFRRLHHAEKKVHALVGQIKATTVAATIDHFLTHDMAGSLSLVSAQVLHRQDDRRFRSAPIFGGTANATVPALATNGPLAIELERTRAALRIEDRATFESDLASAAQTPALAVPIFVSGHLSAVALYGPHRAGDDLKDEEVDLLCTLADAASESYAQIEAASLRAQMLAARKRPPRSTHHPAPNDRDWRRLVTGGIKHHRSNDPARTHWLLAQRRARKRRAGRDTASRSRP